MSGCFRNHCPDNPGTGVRILPETSGRPFWYNPDTRSGILSGCYRKQNIETAKQLLAQETENQKEEALEDGIRILGKQDTVWTEILECIQNFRQPNCPVCKKGRLRFAGLVKDVPWEPG